MSDDEREPPVLWLDRLPVDVQIRIATYVSDCKSGLDALNLAKASPSQPPVVCAALDHNLEHTFASHKDGLVPDWTDLFVDVRVLQLHEHPPNFSLLYSPCLKIVAVEDEPIQLEGLSRSAAVFDRLELTLRYGTPANVICRHLRRVNFRKLDLYENETNFWLDVDTDDLLSACDGVKAVYLHDHFLITNGVAAFLNGLKTLHELTIDLRGSADWQELKSVMKRVKRMRVSVWDSQIPNLVKLATKTKTDLRRVHSYSLGGMDEEALHALRQDVPVLHKMEKLRITLAPGGELLFPQLSNLSTLNILWDRGPASFDDFDPYYKPPAGAILDIVERHPLLKSLKLFEVRLADDELVAIIERLGTRLTKFGMSVEGQDVPQHRRLLTLLKTLSEHCSNLVELEVFCSFDTRENENVREQDRFTNSLKREVLLYLNRLQRRNAKLNLEDVEHVIFNLLELETSFETKQSEKEIAGEIERGLSLRRCRRTLNEVGGDASHFAAMGQLLETGCDGLKQDLDAAAQAYRKAVRMGNHRAILRLWDITDQKTSDSSEPVPGGALALILELVEAKHDAVDISCFADVFLDRTKTSNPPDYRGTARILRLAVSYGRIPVFAKELAKIVEDGYEEVPPNPDGAIELYRSIVDQHDDMNALFSWAEWVYEGYGSQPRDPAGAVNILRSGRWRDCEECINFLGVIAQEGYGEVECNADSAIDFYQWAIDEGSAAAMANLGMLYGRGDERYPADPESAIELFAMAAADGSQTAPEHLLEKLLSEGEDSSGLADCDCEECDLQSPFIRHRSAPLPFLRTYGYQNQAVDQKEAIRLYNDTSDARLSVIWHGRVRCRFSEREVSAIRLPDIGSHRLVLFKVPRDVETELVLTCALGQSGGSKSS